MQLLPVETWERQERGGWTAIMPLDGTMANDSTLLNPTATEVYGLVKEAKSVDFIWKELCKRYPEVAEEKVWMDLVGCIRYLIHLGLVELDQKEAEAVFNRLNTPPAGLSVMDEPEVIPVSELLRRVALGEADTECFYSLMPLSENLHSPHIVRHRHFQGYETTFVYRDEGGEIIGCIAINNGPMLNPVKTVSMLAVKTNGQNENAKHTAVRMLTDLELFVKELFETGKLRFLKKVFSESTREEGGNEPLPAEDDQFNGSWDKLAPVIGECGYRKEVTLVDELGPGVSLEYYSKSLYDSSDSSDVNLKPEEERTIP